MRRGGNCLAPTDCATRAIELLLVFDEAWRKRRLGGAYDLVFVHSMAKNVLDFARSQIEWMCGDAQKSFDGASKRRSGHPLALHDVRCASTVAEALKGDAPKCVVAARGELETGAAARLFRGWASDERSVVVLTSPAPLLGADGAGESVAALLEAGKTEVVVRHGARVALVGESLAVSLAARAERRKAKRAADELRRRADEMARGVLLLEEAGGAAARDVDALDDDLDDDDDDDDAHRNGGGVGLDGREVAAKDGGRRVRRKSQRKLLESFKANALFARFSQPAHATFAPRPKRAPADDYGAPLPQDVVDAMAKARQSLTGLETRDGYGHLAEDLVPSPDGAPHTSGGDAGDGFDAMDVDASEPRRKARTHEDAAYDDAATDDDDPTVAMVAKTLTVAVRCRVVRVRGLEGLCDGRSLKALLSRVAPRSVLVHPAAAGSAAGDKLAKFARDRLFPRAADALVAAPRAGDTVDLAAWLGRAPLADAELSWRIVHAHSGAATPLGDGFEVSRVTAAVLVTDDAAPKKKPPRLVLDSELLETKARALPAGDARNVDSGAAAPHKAPAKLWLSAKDVVLPSLKEKLATEGVKAAFKAGALVCDGAIVVRKEADARGNSKLFVDGPLCPEYYTVSRIVQSAFSLV